MATLLLRGLSAGPRLLPAALLPAALRGLPRATATRLAPRPTPAGQLAPAAPLGHLGPGEAEKAAGEQPLQLAADGGCGAAAAAAAAGEDEEEEEEEEVEAVAGYERLPSTLGLFAAPTPPAQVLGGKGAWRGRQAATEGGPQEGLADELEPLMGGSSTASDTAEVAAEAEARAATGAPGAGRPLQLAAAGLQAHGSGTAAGDLARTLPGAPESPGMGPSAGALNPPCRPSEDSVASLNFMLEGGGGGEAGADGSPAGGPAAPPTPSPAAPLSGASAAAAAGFTSGPPLPLPGPGLPRSRASSASDLLAGAPPPRDPSAIPRLDLPVPPLYEAGSLPEPSAPAATPLGAFLASIAAADAAADVAAAEERAALALAGACLFGPEPAAPGVEAPEAAAAGDGGVGSVSAGSSRGHGNGDFAGAATAVEPAEAEEAGVEAEAGDAGGRPGAPAPADRANAAFSRELAAAAQEIVGEEVQE